MVKISGEKWKNLKKKKWKKNSDESWWHEPMQSAIKTPEKRLWKTVRGPPKTNRSFLSLGLESLISWNISFSEWVHFSSLESYFLRFKKFCRVSISWKITNFFWVSISQNITKAFFWENIRNVFEISISWNIRTAFFWENIRKVPETLKYCIGVQQGQSYLIGRCLFSFG